MLLGPCLAPGAVVRARSWSGVSLKEREREAAGRSESLPAVRSPATGMAPLDSSRLEEYTGGGRRARGGRKGVR